MDISCSHTQTHIPILHVGEVGASCRELAERDAMRRIMAYAVAAVLGIVLITVAQSRAQSKPQPDVQLTGKQLGQVLVREKGNKLGGVCADNFTDLEAVVTCQGLNFRYGLAIVCGAFCNRSYPITRSNVRCKGQEISLNECPYETSLTYCPSKDYAAVVCSNVSSSKGYNLTMQGSRVQVQHMGVWGYICPANYSDNDAAVICRELRFKGGFATLTPPGPGMHVPWLSNLQCTGNERSLTHCKNFKYAHGLNCFRANAGAECYNLTGRQFRLANSSGHAGRIEVAVDGQWGAVCARSLDDTAASLLCRELKYEGGGRALPSGSFGSGPGTVSVVGLSCHSSSRSLSQCFGEWGSRSPPPNCRGQHAAIQCFKHVRLSGSTLPGYGRVEKRVLGNWTAVCDTNFNDTVAKLVCSDLGYADGRKQCCSALGDLDDSAMGVILKSCDPGATSISHCDFIDKIGCPGKTYVSVLCSWNPIVKGTLKVRLMTQNESSDQQDLLGSIEVKAFDTWGPVCNVGWTDKEASVACRELGFLSGVSYYGRSYSKSPMLVGNFSCDGNERDLKSCDYKTLPESTGCRYPIKHTKGSEPGRPAAGVLCYKTSKGLNVRLSGPEPQRGTMQIQFEGEWGDVCGFNEEAATVFCKMLNYTEGRISWRKGDSLMRAWMSDVDCNWDEKSIFECKNVWHEKPGVTCETWEIVCFNDIRLMRDRPKMGLLEVKVYDRWGGVLDRNWGPNETTVACRQLGYKGGSFVCCNSEGYIYDLSMDNVRCLGNESRLQDCKYDHPIADYWNMNEVAVACYNDEPENTFAWLLSGGSNYSGLVEVKYGDIPGRVCADGWDDEDAKVACKKYGYDNGIAHRTRWSSGPLPYWLTQINCSGSERFLRDCPRPPIGTVTSCRSELGASVTCFNQSGISFDIAGGDSPSRGRVELLVDGRRGTICKKDWNKRGASVICRQMGFRDGITAWSTKYTNNTPSLVYSPGFDCKGNETNLLQCTYESLKTVPDTDEECAQHRDDLAVFCYRDVRLDGAYTDANNGPVQVFYQGAWGLVCDTHDFDDAAARRVCQDMGFADGRKVCCSAYGQTRLRMFNMTLKCSGNEKETLQCLKPVEDCSGGFYASVVCFKAEVDVSSTEGYQFIPETDGEPKGFVSVLHYRVKGYVCSTAWSDVEAKVFCRSRGYRGGLTYTYVYDYSGPYDGPLWVSAVSCTGTENSLSDCNFNKGNNLGNCTGAHRVAVTCFHTATDIQYRLADGGDHYGRVETIVGGISGTICDVYWDNREATVLCRQLNFTDGYALGGAYYGEGEGPVWLSEIACLGNETSLHQCPHSGFDNEVVAPNSTDRYCKDHSKDASVYCIGKLRLNIGLNATQGAVEVNHNGSWGTVCDEHFQLAEARTVCMSLGFKDGAPLLGSKFTTKVDPIGISKVQCDSTKDDFFQCNIKYGETCTTGTTAGVACSHDVIVDRGFKMSLILDGHNADFHGFLHVEKHGVQGGICAHTFDSRAAMVACKQLKFAGGLPYANFWHHKPTSINTFLKLAILMETVNCTGSEASLDACSSLSKNIPWCHFDTPRAGVVCYNSTSSGMEGIKFRIANGSSSREGRLEMSYNGDWRAFCARENVEEDYKGVLASVGCRQVGFQAGKLMHGRPYVVPGLKYWTKIYRCLGWESSFLECISSGFNKTSIFDGCGSSGPVAVKCYDPEPGTPKPTTTAPLPNTDRTTTLTTTTTTTTPTPTPQERREEGSGGTSPAAVAVPVVLVLLVLGVVAGVLVWRRRRSSQSLFLRKSLTEDASNMPNYDSQLSMTTTGVRFLNARELSPSEGFSNPVYEETSGHGDPSFADVPRDFSSSTLAMPGLHGERRSDT